MATITAPTVLRHVRKTITFTGGANAGELDSPITVFTTTGHVRIAHISAPRITTNLTCSAPTQVYFTLGTPDINEYLFEQDSEATFDFTSGTGLLDFGVEGVYDSAWALMGVTDQAIEVMGDIILTPNDAGSGANITGGVLVVDAWYYPITDDGALAGDDIDVNLGASIASILADTNELQGDWANGGRLDLLLDAVKVVTDAINSLDNSLTAQQAFNVILSAVAGKVSGAESNAPVFRDIADSKDRITATTDASGNRTAVTVDAS